MKEGQGDEEGKENGKGKAGEVVVEVSASRNTNGHSEKNLVVEQMIPQEENIQSREEIISISKPPENSRISERRREEQPDTALVQDVEQGKVKKEPYRNSLSDIVRTESINRRSRNDKKGDTACAKCLVF